MRLSRDLINACLGGLAGIVLTAQIPAGHAMARVPDALLVTAADAGKSVTLTVGQSLEVRLEAQPGTGTIWSVSPDSTKLLKYNGSKSAASANIPGGTEIEVLSFTAVTKGRGTLRLIYSRPWEKNAPPAKTFSLVVDIDGG